MARVQRFMSDHRFACSQLRQIMSTLDLHHIKECTRLVKYSNPLPRPRPLLITLVVTQLMSYYELRATYGS